MTDVTTLDNGNVLLSMACACGDERRAQMAEIRTRAREILELEDESRLVTNILHALNFWYRGHSFSIDHVSVDQWMAVALSDFVYGQSKYGDKLRLIFVHCDAFEDGLATLFVYIHETYERDDFE